SQIEMATRRIVALHASDESVTHASKLLAMSHGSLSDWLARRTLPGKPQMAYDDDDIADHRQPAAPGRPPASAPPRAGRRRAAGRAGFDGGVAAATPPLAGTGIAVLQHSDG